MPQVGNSTVSQFNQLWSTCSISQSLQEKIFMFLLKKWKQIAKISTVTVHPKHVSCALSWQNLPLYPAFNVSGTVVLNIFAEWSQIQTYNIARKLHLGNFNTSHLTCFVSCRTKSVRWNILEVLLKDCWGLHKGCLGATYGSQNSGWEPLLWDVAAIRVDCISYIHNLYQQ